jgi:hypothetical protein
MDDVKPSSFKACFDHLLGQVGCATPVLNKVVEMMLTLEPVGKSTLAQE